MQRYYSENENKMCNKYAVINTQNEISKYFSPYLVIIWCFSIQIFLLLLLGEAVK